MPGATVFLQAGQDLRIGGRQSNAQYQYTIQSDNLQDLVKWGPDPAAADEKTPRLHRRQQRSAKSAAWKPRSFIDRDTAARLGITPQTIDNTLYDAFGQRQVSTMYTPLNQYHVVMEVAPHFWQSPDGLNDIYVTSANRQARFRSAPSLSYEPTTTPLAVNHQGQFPSVTISFNLAPGVRARATPPRPSMQMEQNIGMPATIHGMFSGTRRPSRPRWRPSRCLILAALVAVYIVLGILYESYIHPITILSTLPSAGVGALLALMLFHTDLSIIALIGIILLIGIVKKNAILMIDFALAAERKEGKSPERCHLSRPACCASGRF